MTHGIRGREGAKNRKTPLRTRKEDLLSGAPASHAGHRPALRDGSPRRFVSLPAFLLAMLLLPGLAGAYGIKELLHNRFPPEMVYRTVETPHFRIHFVDGLDAQARHLAELAEPVHREVCRLVDWEPRQKTDLVLTLNSERTNAFTVSYPTTQILINNVPPYMSQAIFSYGDWMRWLLVHEYTHVVHIDRVAGLSAALRPLLGTWDKPNMLQPPWLREGAAVWVESQLETRGRADSAIYRMVLRQAEKDGLLGTREFAGLENSSHLMAETWPWLIRGYLWGEALAQAMEQLRPGAFAAVAEAGARGVPGALSPTLAAAGLPPAEAIQVKAVEWTGARARRELEILGRRPETPAERLTHDGFDKFGLAIDPDGAELVFTRQRPEVDNATMLLPLAVDGTPGNPRELFPHFIGYHHSYSRSGRYIAFDEVDFFRRFYLFGDLFLFDRKEDRAVLRSRGLRGRDPDIHPDGKTLAFIQTVVDKNVLTLCDSGFGNLRPLFTPPGFERLAQPRWNPDGSALVFVQHDDAKGGEQLLLWDGSDTVKRLTDGSSIDRDPIFSPDGRFLLFSSDRGGAFQLYALELESLQLRQVTHRHGGAFWPVPDPKGRWLYFFDYGTNGYDVARMPWDPSAWWSPDPSLWLAPPGSEEARGPGLPPRAVVEPERGIPFEPRDYSPWGYLAPQYLRPSFVLRRDTVQLGLETGAVDPAFGIHWRTSARWDADSGELVGEAFWYDGRGALPWRFELTRDLFAVEGGEGEMDLVVGDLRGYLPLGEHTRGITLEMGITGQRYERDGAPQELLGATVKFEQEQQVQQKNDVVPEVGVYRSLELTHFRRRDDEPLTMVQARWNQPFRLTALGPHSILTAGLDGIWIDDHGGSEYLVYGGGELSFPFDLGSRLPFPAYQPNALAADRALVASARFTRPIASIQRGLVSLPAYVDRVSWGVRGEYGRLERQGEGIRPWSVGAELYLETDLGYLWPTFWTLGAYHGDPDTGGENRVVLTARFSY